ncbi:MAG TPA: hypothetical protein ENJ09_12320 [Planctomycetes bacterium]|nr:hypothetical protein [Planctomycetota bacterium]
MSTTAPSATPARLLADLLGARLSPGAQGFWRGAVEEARGEAPPERIGALLALASRHARDRTALDPGGEALARAAEFVPGWNPERWRLLETLRVTILLAWPALDAAAGENAVGALEELFRYADEGEQRALYRALALLEDPGRFRDRAAEGCRTNILGVFEADVLDTPYPARHFDDVAFHQAVLKSLFLGAPLWRLYGLDSRLSPELARMALDYTDERRSAGRDVPPEVWLALGAHGGQRAVEAIERELDPANPNTLGRIGAIHALGRAGHRERLVALHESEIDPEARAAVLAALDHPHTSPELAFLHPRD